MLSTLSRYHQSIAWFFVAVFYAELVLVPLSSRASVSTGITYRNNYSSHYKTPKTEIGNQLPFVETIGTSKTDHYEQVENGPGQPEMQAFSSVNNSNMVDLFTGDFSYNIPLMDVGGYPVNLAYRAGNSMDQEASWVGLGWNINPGTIGRNLRGLPDEFDGKYDSIKKTLSTGENKTVGVTVGASWELGGLPGPAKPTDTSKSFGNISANLGLFHNTYKGWGLEYGVNASLNAGAPGSGALTGGLSITNNTQEGVTISPSFSAKIMEMDLAENSSLTGTFSASLPYNSRAGLKGLQLSTGVRQYHVDQNNQRHIQSNIGSGVNSFISFVNPAFTPSISMPYTSKQVSFTGKTGLLKKIFDANTFISGYVSTQSIKDNDKEQRLPAYGYLNYQNANGNQRVLLDFNLEKDMPYREKPPVPHIALPSYTYDAFSITGEGTGGMFRAYRGDIGYVHDHYMRTKDESDRLSIDFAGLDLVHAGVDLNINRAHSQSGAWIDNNSMRKLIGFKKDTLGFEAAYFRNPGEKSINSTGFYNAIGSDDVVAIKLNQPSIGSSSITATEYLTRYKNKRVVDHKLLTADSAYKRQRDKRTQVISYLNAKEASVVGLSKYIENYTPNVFDIKPCEIIAPAEGLGTGLMGAYFTDTIFSSLCETRPDATIDFDNDNKNAWPACITTIIPPFDIKVRSNFSVRWVGRLRVPETGLYTIEVFHDDGARLFINDELQFNKWLVGANQNDTVQRQLVGGQFYDIKLEYYEKDGEEKILLRWKRPGESTTSIIPTAYLYPPADPEFQVGTSLKMERRISDFRKPNHISEVCVLNNDGRRYIYGIPVYNLIQKDKTFSVLHDEGASQTGLVNYASGNDTKENDVNKEKYYKSEEIPAYAHSFLLTGIVSPDYADLTGNGISDDDRGDAVKFNYSKLAGYDDPFEWRTPHGENKANYNEGLKSDRRDDKANLVYGKKELWYLHSIESKTMIATFELETRTDLRNVDSSGVKTITSKAKRLKTINLYTKADLAKYKSGAKPIKTVHFQYSYELCPGINGGDTTGKLTLKKVWFTYNKNNKGAQNPYVFFYKNNQPYQLKAYDRWGNYKNALQNPGSTENALIGNDEYPYALQDSALAAENAGAWNLDSIYLPSGGSLKVAYESDDYAYVQNKRAMQMLKPAGFAAKPDLTSGFTPMLYNSADKDNNFIYFTLPQAVVDAKDFYNKYLQGVQKIYFRLNVKMPAVQEIGSGNEYVSGYGDIDTQNGYGISNSTTAWIKLAGISLNADGPGEYSPMAKTAIQFLRMNLPGKAYPNSEPGDHVDVGAAVKMIVSSFKEIVNAFTSYDKLAREQSFAREVDLNKSFIRLNNPEYKKYGGGYRVKHIKIYDNWNRMTGRRGAVYGQEYTYTTQKQINGVVKTISSGVASYEPGIGGEENPFRQPIEYVDKSSVLGPVNLGYSEEPLGESFFPSASVGYSKISVRTINHKNVRSANGFEETQFYTAYDYPTYTDRSLIDNNTKKRFKPSLSNFLRINTRHHLAISQGFKVELNDMNGKLRSKAYYAETDLKTPIVYTENIYRTENLQAEHKKLSNLVTVIKPDGEIDTTATIGKDVELMVAFREQRSISEGNNINVNVDVFKIPALPPVFVYPSFFYMYQREENLFRSASVVKVIQRYGILDSVINIEKGSKISTKDIAYDSETGDVLLSRTYNEFNDPVYNFTYPTHWGYDLMGLAYKNINSTYKHVSIKSGRIPGVTFPYDDIKSGDEFLVGGKLATFTGPACTNVYSSFPSYDKIWAVNRRSVSGGSNQLFFVDKDGKPYDADDATLKVIRSGRRNMLNSLSSFTSLENPLQYYEGVLTLVPHFSKVVNAKSSEYKQIWQVDDKKIRETGMTLTNCETRSNGCSGGAAKAIGNGNCVTNCLKNVYMYVRDNNNNLFRPQFIKIQVNDLFNDPDAAPYNLDYCTMVDTLGYYYAHSIGSSGLVHRLNLGQWTVRIEAPTIVGFRNLKPFDYIADTVLLYDSVNFPSGDTVIAKMYFEGYATPECDTIYSTTCKSAIGDSTFNPYITGAAGNWRLYKNYTYYGRREQSDPSVLTNIRTDGVFKDFLPAWIFVGGLIPYHSAVPNWVWNSEMTLFNKKGFEIENKDPLGRYNSGLYGYNQTMPVAVIQNSRYRESGFDGFEDYDFKTQVCDTVCSSNKQMDFSDYKNWIDSTVAHTGRHSLKIPGESQASLLFTLSDTAWDNREPAIEFATASSCGTVVLEKITGGQDMILPSFNPLRNKKMVISAWVKETGDCSEATFVNNNIGVYFDDDNNPEQFVKKGPVIEGWQQYERVFDIPDNANEITIVLRATGSGAVNFDDVRVHPYNANMKSFVFDPKNLRLMAELDDNNYATFYEYDDDGTLIRLKKETERGVKTIKETRSALLKEQ